VEHDITTAATGAEHDTTAVAATAHDITVVAVGERDRTTTTTEASEGPDIILMGVNLPVIDGLEAMRQIKARPETRSVPRIALTAPAMAGARDKALEAGCDDYHPKPVEFP